MADKLTKPLSRSEKLRQSGEVFTDGSRRNITPFLKRLKKENLQNYRPVSLTSVPSSVMGQIFLNTMLRHMENEQVIGDSQYGFTKGKLCLTDLVAFYGGVTALVDKGRTINIIYLHLDKASATVPDDILVSVLERHGFDGVFRG